MAIQLRKDGSVRVKARVALDLGGIAKGFAVDKAVELLRERGMQSGMVNAGGDLRVFGDEPQPIWVRCPTEPTRVQMLGMLTNGAIATSAAYFTNSNRLAESTTSAIVDTKRGRRVFMTGSVSVIARNCMLADALTKIAILKGRLPARIVRHAQAKVLNI